MHPTLLFLLCLMPGDFGCQSDTTATQWVKHFYLPFRAFGKFSVLAIFDEFLWSLPSQFD